MKNVQIWFIVDHHHLLNLTHWKLSVRSIVVTIITSKTNFDWLIFQLLKCIDDGRVEAGVFVFAFSRAAQTFWVNCQSWIPRHNSASLKHDHSRTVHYSDGTIQCLWIYLVKAVGSTLIPNQLGVDWSVYWDARSQNIAEELSVRDRVCDLNE